MITKFSSLYAGSVDMEDLGFEGTPVNKRRYPNEYLVTALYKAREMSQFLDNLGFHCLWMAEHHFQPEGYECIPNILQLSVDLAHYTKNIKFGCGFNVGPMWHPLRLAEDYSTADILTGGRVIFGIGRGYHSREVESFGAPVLDQDANRELFEEQIEIMFKAFNHESFSHHGKHYDIPPAVPYRGYLLEEISLVPRPLNLPVECWQPIVSGSQRALDFMAKYQINGVIGGGAASGGAAMEVVKTWQDTLAKHGTETELGGNLCVGISVHLADTEAQGIKEAKKYLEEYQKMFGPFGFVRGLSDEQKVALGDPQKARSAGLPTVEDNVREGSWICGPPDLVTEKLLELEHKFPGLDQVSVGHATVGTPFKEWKHQMDWFGREIMPNFTNRPKATATENK